MTKMKKKIATSFSIKTGNLIIKIIRTRSALRNNIRIGWSNLKQYRRILLEESKIVIRQILEDNQFNLPSTQYRKRKL